MALTFYLIQNRCFIFKLGHKKYGSMNSKITFYTECKATMLLYSNGKSHDYYTEAPQLLHYKN